MYLCVFSLSLCGDSNGAPIEDISNALSFTNVTNIKNSTNSFPPSSVNDVINRLKNLSELDKNSLFINQMDEKVFTLLQGIIKSKEFSVDKNFGEFNKRFTPGEFCILAEMSDVLDLSNFLIYPSDVAFLKDKISFFKEIKVSDTSANSLALCAHAHLEGVKTPLFDKEDEFKGGALCIGKNESETIEVIERVFLEKKYGTKEWDFAMCYVLSQKDAFENLRGIIRDLNPSCISMKTWVSENEEAVDHAIFSYLKKNRNYWFMKSPSSIVSIIKSEEKKASQRGNILGDEGVKVFCLNQAFINVTELNLSYNRLGKQGVKCLAKSRFLKNIVKMDLSLNKIGDLGVIYITESPNFKKLTDLNLGKSNIGPEGAVMIAQSKILKGLKNLNLESSQDMSYINMIGDAGTIAIAKSVTLEGLVSLNLCENKLSDKSAIAIAQSKAFKNLTILKIAFNTQIRSDSVKILAKSPHLEKLKELDVTCCGIGDDFQEVQALLESRFPRGV